MCVVLSLVIWTHFVDTVVEEQVTCGEGPGSCVLSVCPWLVSQGWAQMTVATSTVTLHVNTMPSMLLC